MGIYSITNWVGFGFIGEALVIPWFHQEPLLIGVMVLSGLGLIYFKDEHARDLVNKVVDKKK